MKEGITNNFNAPIILNGGTLNGDIVNPIYNFGSDGKPNAQERRQMAIDCMEARISEAVAKGKNNWKHIFAPFVAGIRVGLVPNNMSYETFNQKYQTQVAQSTFSTYVPKDIARSEISKIDSEPYENEFFALLNME